MTGPLKRPVKFLRVGPKRKYPLKMQAFYRQTTKTPLFLPSGCKTGYPCESRNNIADDCPFKT